MHQVPGRHKPHRQTAPVPTYRLLGGRKTAASIELPLAPLQYDHSLKVLIALCGVFALFSEFLKKLPSALHCTVGRFWPSSHHFLAVAELLPWSRTIVLCNFECIYSTHWFRCAAPQGCFNYCNASQWSTGKWDCTMTECTQRSHLRPNWHLVNIDYLKIVTGPGAVPWNPGLSPRAEPRDPGINWRLVPG
jgi:hypothetical protein